MPTTPRKSPPAFPWKAVLHFANATVTSTNWQAILLQKRGARVPPGQRLFGFDDVEQVRAVLLRFRDVLGTLLSYTNVASAEHSMILHLINERARATLHGWTWIRGTGRVFPQIRTQGGAFEEYLYAQLAVAMTAEPFTHFKRCRVCERFFHEPRQRIAPLCSVACRDRNAKARVAQYREEHRDEYREYQRKLMARRRGQGTS